MALGPRYLSEDEHTKPPFGTMHKGKANRTHLHYIRYLVPLCGTISLIGYFGPWVHHHVAGLAITGLDLGEFVKFLPGVRTNQLILWRQGFYLPLCALSLILSMAAYRKELAFPFSMRAPILLLAAVAALNLLPPAWSPILLISPEFILQTAAMLLCSTAALHAGPPWVSIEYPANPHHPTTRDAALLLRAYHHSSALNVAMRGVAEGIVDGKRVSKQIEVVPTHTPGLFAVRSALPKGGTWVLVFTTKDGSADATALVTVDANARIVAVDVPSERTNDGWTVPRSVTQQEIEAKLKQAHMALGDASTTPARGDRAIAIAALPLLLLGVYAFRRRA